MTKEEIIRNLKYTMEKHKNDTVNTFGTNISIMCKDILDYLEQEPCEGRMKYVQETVNTIMDSCKTDSIKDKCFRNAARFIQNAIDGSSPEFELINDAEPCEDAISREAVIDTLTKTSGMRGDALKALYDLPSVNTQPKTGHWIIKEGREQGYDIAGIKTWYIQIMCDKCGFIKTAIEGHTGQYHFCPNCGARMERENKENVKR